LVSRMRIGGSYGGADAARQGGQPSPGGGVGGDTNIKE
jgi:hypothetical protein